MDRTKLNEFGMRYAKAWCSQDPESVAAFYAEDGSLSVNDGPPAVGRLNAEAFRTTPNAWLKGEPPRWRWGGQ